VQRKLGISPATGYFGSVTQSAVKRFQAAHGISATGVVAAVTWAALARSATTTSTVKKKTSKNRYPTLRYGMDSPYVTVLQSKLRMPVRSTHFGDMTLSYVKSLQRAAGLRATGVVAKSTWRKAGKVWFRAPSASSASSSPGGGGGSVPSGTKAAQVMAIARSLAGIPYVATGYSPSQGFNCSSYTQWVFQKVGVNLGGAYTVTQYANTKHIKRSQARPGDLVFYYNYPNNFLGHVGIYAGNNMMWHAPRTGRVVSLDQIYSDKVIFSRPL